MRFCSKCRREKEYSEIWLWGSKSFFQVFGKWICSDCFLRSGGKKHFLRQAKSKLRKRVPPKSIRDRSFFERLEEKGLIKLRKRWHREDLNRVFECYQVLKPLGVYHLFFTRKPKKGKMVWREVVFKKELEK